MIKDLVYKEFHLNINPWSLLFLASALLLFIPSWVFFVAVGYIFLFFMLIGQWDKANQDLAFAMALPVPKSGIVTARTCAVVLVELAELVIAAVVAVARYFLYQQDNSAGMNTNLAFFGLMLVMFAIFNLIYLPGSYKRAYRLLWPILGGALVSVVLMGTVTSLIAFVPSWSAILNDRGFGHAWAQVLVFAAGVVSYAGLTWLAWRKARSNFAKVDL